MNLTKKRVQTLEQFCKKYENKQHRRDLSDVDLPKIVRENFSTNTEKDIESPKNKEHLQSNNSNVPSNQNIDEPRNGKNDEPRNGNNDERRNGNNVEPRNSTDEELKKDDLMDENDTEPKEKTEDTDDIIMTDKRLDSQAQVTNTFKKLKTYNQNCRIERIKRDQIIINNYSSPPNNYIGPLAGYRIPREQPYNSHFGNNPWNTGFNGQIRQEYGLNRLQQQQQQQQQQPPLQQLQPQQQQQPVPILDASQLNLINELEELRRFKENIMKMQSSPKSDFSPHNSDL